MVPIVPAEDELMSTYDEARTYHRESSVVFRKTKEAFGGLSNMAAGFPLEIGRIRILTSEALYQACRFPHRPDLQQVVIEQPSPMTAKMKVKPYRRESRHDWNLVRVDVMSWCLQVKLVQNSEKFGALLLATGGSPIVEESARDDFWGAKAVDEGTLVGRNVLGRLLMDLREHFLSRPRNGLSVLEPLGIPEFLLAGKPIGTIRPRMSQSTDTALFDISRFGSFGADDSYSVASGTSFAPALVGASRDRQEIRSEGLIPMGCKRLAEVDFPIAEVSRHAAREKSIRHGHPSTLHLWWARRPLASSRAMLLALLLPDPCDSLCPDDFKASARRLLSEVQGKPGPNDLDLRKGLLKFIADFANWDLASNSKYIEVGRGLVKAAHGEEPPLVVDPFAGGGSIPLEALRLGCDTFASDLNPVACLILKVMLEDIPRYGPELADELRRVGAEIKKQAEEELADLYPKDPDGATPIAYLWARTVQCESPNCGAEIPLLRSLWLCKKRNRKRALRYTIKRPDGQPPQVEFEIFEPKTENEVLSGTVSRARASCVACGIVLAPQRVRAQLVAQSGGADVIFDIDGQRVGGARIVTVVSLDSTASGRIYRLPLEMDYMAVLLAQRQVARIAAEWVANGSRSMSPFPEEPTPAGGGSGAGRAFSLRSYGRLQWSDLFAARQKRALFALAKASTEANLSVGVRELVALSIGKTADLGNAGAPWKPGAECPVHMLSSQKIPPSWDWAEAVLTSSSSGSFESAYSRTATTLDAAFAHPYQPGSWDLEAAQSQALSDESASVWFTDPPYYDAVPYADLSDFFFVWLKRALPGHGLMRDPFDAANSLTPKRQEAVQDESRNDNGQRKDQEWFEGSMATAFKEGRRVLSENGIGAVVFAHKSTEGWEALLSGMTQGGWTITGSWPIATEMGTRLRARDSAALATSVHLVCRPRPEDAGVGDWASVLKELPKRVVDWMARLQGEGVLGADLVFACIGPALEIYSRYEKVETAEGREVGLGEYLEKVWEVVGRTALESILGTTEAGTLEEDARLTALFLWTLQSTIGEPAESGNNDDSDSETDTEDEDGEEGGGSRSKAKGYSLIFDVVRRFAQPLGIDLPQWEDRIIDIKKGVVRLLPITERAKQLFGEEGAQGIAARLEKQAENGPNPLQGILFPDEAETVPNRKRTRQTAGEITDDTLHKSARQVTTLDRVHTAMLLQAGGRSNALRTLLKNEQDRGPEFHRLANALSALYPKGAEEKRLLDAMLLATPR